MKFLNNTFLLLLLSFGLFVIPACDKETEDPLANLNINEFVYETMKDTYLWNTEVPQGIDPNTYGNPEDLLDALKFTPTDKWSFITEDNGAFSDRIAMANTVTGLGLFIGVDNVGTPRIALVEPNSPAARANLKRGDWVMKINGANITTNEQLTNLGTDPVLTIRNANGIRDVQLQVASYEQSQILNTTIFDLNGTKVGYLAYLSFTDASGTELEQAFADFKAQGVSEMILDLRYNTGGLVDIAIQMGSLLAPGSALGQQMIRLDYNADHPELDIEYAFTSEASNLNLSQLYVLTTINTASASEVVINGLRPYMDVYLVGSTTSGKYVGSNVYVRDGYSFAPISFKLINSVGFTDYIDGLDPNFTAIDDLKKNFGDQDEAMIATALSEISGGLIGKRQPVVGTTEVFLPSRYQPATLRYMPVE